MSRAAKITLAASAVVSGLTVWGVHYMQEAERANMYKGVERDEARQAEKRRQRELDLQINKEREQRFQQVQPTSGYLARQREEQGQQSASGAGAEKGSQAPESSKGSSWWR